MINVLLSATRLVAAQQKKNGRRGAHTKQLCALALPEGTEDYNAPALALRDKLRQMKVKDAHVNLILGEQIVFKEFSHLPVGAKALADFSRLEAQTVLRENVDAYTVEAMHYGPHKNEAGETTSMLLAAPQLTGAAIDFGYEYTLINLFAGGHLVSQRRLGGVLAALAPAVMEDTGCALSEVSEKLAENSFSPAYAEKARAMLTNFTFDILRTLRVLSAPLHIQPETFFLSGAACRDKAFLALVQESLALPCVLADSVQDKLRGVLGGPGSVTGLLVLSGPAYDAVDFLTQLRQKKTGSVFNMTTCVLVTLLAVAGLCVQPAAKLLKQHSVTQAQAAYDALADAETGLSELAAARALTAQIQQKSETLSQYTSNTGATLPQVLGLFGPSFTLQEVVYSSEYGSYQVSFLSDTKENFLALKDRIYGDSDYYLQPSLSIVRQQEDGSYLCQMYFVPADNAVLPAEPAAASEAESAVSVTTDSLAEGVLG